MELDSSDVFVFEAKSCKWRLRFTKIVDVKREWLADFLLWLAPKMGFHAVLDSVTYERAVASGCHLDVRTRFTPCDTDAIVEATEDEHSVIQSWVL